MEVYLFICHSPEVDIYLFTSFTKCKKFFITHCNFDEDEWELLIQGNKVIDNEGYYWEFRKQRRYGYL